MNRFNLLRLLLLLTLLLLPAGLVQAARVTVTNEGTDRARVQYKTPDGPYENIYVEPGQTVDIPGGVEKVKVVRELGEWARPFHVGEVLRVLVNEEGRDPTVLDYYGEKAFLSELSTAPPEPEPSVEPVKKPLIQDVLGVPESEEVPEPKPQHRQLWWPWFGGIGLFPILFIMLLIGFPFLLGLGRSLWRPGFGAGSLYAGKSGIMTMMLVLGLILGGWGIFGYGFYEEPDTFLSFLSHDLYLYPLWLLMAAGSFFGNGLGFLAHGGFPFLIVPLFWILICLSFGGGIRLRLRAPWMYMILALLAFFPASMFIVGFLGPEAYAGIGSTTPLHLHSGIFSSLVTIPLIFLIVLQFISPYNSYLKPPEPQGCLLPSLGFGFGLLVAVFILLGWDNPVFGSPLAPALRVLVGLPLMFGLPNVLWPLPLFLFYGTSFGLLGAGLGRCGGMNCVFRSTLPALIGIIFFAFTFHVGDDMYLNDDLFWARERVFYELGYESEYDYASKLRRLIDLEPESGQTLLRTMQDETSLDRFGDNVGRRRVMRAYEHLGREIISTLQGGEQDHDHYDDRKW